MKTLATKIQDTEKPREWTFFTNHSHVIFLLAADPECTIRDMALKVGITERAVQNIIQDLEAGGYVSRTKVGRNNKYKVNLKKELRHPIENHRKLSDIFEALYR
jgi:DNA-binding MarR family transcriptional regulator